MSATRLLVLAGFVCQGLASQHVAWAALFAALWLAATRIRLRRPLLPELLEAALFMAGLVLAYRYSRRFEFPLFVSLGFPLLFVQLLRLPLAQDARALLFTAVIAVTHIAIGSLAIFDYKFVLLLVPTILLLPRTLSELEAARLHGERLRLGGRAELRRAAMVVLLMAGFFVLLPRPRLGSRMGMGMTPTMMDAASSGSATGSRPLFRVEGEQLGYLQIGTLDTFDGRFWTISRESNEKLRDLPELPAAGSEGLLRRSVRVQSLDALGRALPADGSVVALDATFLRQPYVSVQGGIKGRRFRPDEGEYRYDYWIDPQAPPEPLGPQERGLYVAVPRQSERLALWLRDVAGTDPDPLAQAERIATHLRENFHYNLGAPMLNRLTPIDELVFEQRQGHCERFASALAVLLRMRGIPARVAMGYLPLDTYRSGTTTVVTEKQGHAWTEAYIEGRGWVDLDATPYATSPGGLPQPLHLRIYEWIQSTWYQKVVFFSSEDRRGLLRSAFLALRAPFELIASHFQQALLALAGLGAALALAFSGRRAGSWLGMRRRRPSEQARHFYGQMLRHLARRGHVRQPAQTPLELLAELRAAGHPQLEDIAMVTETFCAARYGAAELDAAAEARMQAALGRIARPRRASAGKP
jgi:hypothetical protein